VREIFNKIFTANKQKKQKITNKTSIYSIYRGEDIAMKNHKHHSTEALKKRIADSRDRLFRVAFAWCGDEMLADDLAQETMTAGIINNGQLRDEKQLYAWLFSILRNNWLRYLRRAKHQAELNDELPARDSGPLRNAQELETVRRVRHALTMLTLEQREVISLIDLDELSYSEVAEILDIPIGTVMSRLHRARKKLLAKLKKPEEEVSEQEGGTAISNKENVHLEEGAE